nr:hypothetical protein [Eubacterium sp.]
MKIKKINPATAGVIALAVILIGVLAFGGIYCTVNKETPSELIHDVVTPDDEQLIGKWQGEKAINGYEFYDDGTYD